MITPSDFITLPFTPDLTEAGIAYACRSLAFTYDRMGGSAVERMRRIASGVAIELAFRRCLVAQGVPHDNLGRTPFTDPDHYDLALGGRQCDLKSFQLFRQAEIRRLHHNPGLLLSASALVPCDQVASENRREFDLYIFAFSTARVVDRAVELERTLNAGGPACLVHPLTHKWVQPARWESLGRLVFKAEARDSLFLELGGQGENRAFQTEVIELKPGEKALVQKDYYSLAYLRLNQVPGGRIGVYSPSLRSTHLVSAGDWGNSWVYGMDIILTGYTSHGEFRRLAQYLPSGSRVQQYARTRTDNLSLPVGDLHPLGDLFERVKTWHANRKQKDH